MQALSQLSYGPTWRRGTLPDRGAIRQENERATRSRAPCARASRDNDSVFPKMAKVASMGGDTVPPHTASRMGCASLPSAMPLAAANAADEFVNRGGDPILELSKSAVSGSASSASTSAVTCLRTAFSS